MAEVVFAEGMMILDNNNDLEEERAIHVMQWEPVLVCSCTIWIVDRTDTLD